jgi:hypothetical protein
VELSSAVLIAFAARLLASALKRTSSPILKRNVEHSWQ